jgi:transcriptional regulator GlxA family with amidase domain
VSQPPFVLERIRRTFVLPRHVRRAEAFIRANVSGPLRLEDIARHAIISPRALCQGFQKHLATSPLALHRAIRLELARADLLSAAESDSVTRIALRYGFAHIGHFGQHYLQRFGETPQQTLQSRS